MFVEAVAEQVTSACDGLESWKSGKWVSIKLVWRFQNCAKVLEKLLEFSVGKIVRQQMDIDYR